jgi:hypothetical protein
VADVRPWHSPVSAVCALAELPGPLLAVLAFNVHFLLALSEHFEGERTEELLDQAATTAVNHEWALVVATVRAIKAFRPLDRALVVDFPFVVVLRSGTESD